MTNDVIPYQDPKALAEFLDQPEVKIAELVTGALAMGRSEATLVAGRLVQGALKGNLMKQLGREIQELIKRGRIKEDYAKEKFGFQSLLEMLMFIDSDTPDVDRFKAVKALFFSVVDKKTPAGSEILRYQLFQICKKLSSSQFLTLKAAHKMMQNGNHPSGAQGWFAEAAKEVGHNSSGLIENDSVILEQEKLIGERTYSDKSGLQNPQNARLTDLGIKLVELILNYEDFAEDKD